MNGSTAMAERENNDNTRAYKAGAARATGERAMGFTMIILRSYRKLLTGFHLCCVLVVDVVNTRAIPTTRDSVGHRVSRVWCPRAQTQSVIKHLRFGWNRMVRDHLEHSGRSRTGALAIAVRADHPATRGNRDCGTGDCREASDCCLRMKRDVSRHTSAGESSVRSSVLSRVPDA